MGKHTVNKQIITFLFLHEIPDILKKIEKKKKNSLVSIEFYSDGSGELKLSNLDSNDESFEFEDLKELREYFMINEYSDKNI